MLVTPRRRCLLRSILMLFCHAHKICCARYSVVVMLLIIDGFATCLRYTRAALIYLPYAADIRCAR